MSEKHKKPDSSHCQVYPVQHLGSEGTSCRHLGQSVRTGQMVILYRIFSVVEGETQTPGTQSRESTEWLFSVSHLLVRVWNGRTPDSSMFHYHCQLVQSLCQGRIMGKAWITLHGAKRPRWNTLRFRGKLAFWTNKQKLSLDASILFKYTCQWIPSMFIFVFDLLCEILISHSNEMLQSSTLPWRKIFAIKKSIHKTFNSSYFKVPLLINKLH